MRKHRCVARHPTNTAFVAQFPTHTCQCLLQSLPVALVANWRAHDGCCRNREVRMPHEALVECESGSNGLTDDALPTLTCARNLRRCNQHAGEPIGLLQLLYISKRSRAVESWNRSVPSVISRSKLPHTHFYSSGCRASVRCCGSRHALLTG